VSAPSLSDRLCASVPLWWKKLAPSSIPMHPGLRLATPHAGPETRSLCTVGWTKFVSNTMQVSRSGSIQSEHPVKPRWPTAGETGDRRREIRWPGPSSRDTRSIRDPGRPQNRRSTSAGTSGAPPAGPAPPRQRTGRWPAQADRSVREKPGVTCHPAHGKGVEVVHLAAKHASAHRTTLGGRQFAIGKRCRAGKPVACNPSGAKRNRSAAHPVGSPGRAQPNRPTE